MRTTSPFEDKLLAMIEPAATELGYAIVRIRLMVAKHKTLQIMAERLSDGGMNAIDCEKLSRGLSPLLEAEDPIDDEYSLEVSSPGIDRPLTRLEDFDRWSGWEAKVELDRLADGRKRFTGTLAGTENSQICMNLKGESDTVLIPFDWIDTAKLVLTDELIRETLRSRGAGADQLNELDEALTQELPVAPNTQIQGD